MDTETLNKAYAHFSKDPKMNLLIETIEAPVWIHLREIVGESNAPGVAQVFRDQPRVDARNQEAAAIGIMPEPAFFTF